MLTSSRIEKRMHNMASALHHGEEDAHQAGGLRHIKEHSIHELDGMDLSAGCDCVGRYTSAPCHVRAGDSTSWEACNYRTKM